MKIRIEYKSDEHYSEPDNGYLLDFVVLPDGTIKAMVENNDGRVVCLDYNVIEIVK